MHHPVHHPPHHPLHHPPSCAQLALDGRHRLRGPQPLGRNLRARGHIAQARPLRQVCHPWVGWRLGPDELAGSRRLASAHPAPKPPARLNACPLGPRIRSPFAHRLSRLSGGAEAVEIARRAKDANSASEQITQVARERWRRMGPMADDITAVVVALAS
eukprot:3001739-Prymnesium_polylepis.1